MTYKEMKEKIRQEAMEYQDMFTNGETIFWSDIAYYYDYFSKYGKRYGLLKEFRENGII